MSCPNCGGGDKACWCKQKARRDAENARQAAIRRLMPRTYVASAIAPVTLQRLVELAKARGCTVDTLVNKALDHYAGRMNSAQPPCR